MDIVTSIGSFIAMTIQLILFVFGGLLAGIFFYRKRMLGFAYAGFGHFVGSVVSLLVTMWIAREDGSLGIMIIFVYPFFTFIFIIAGALLGRHKQKQLQEVGPQDV